MVSVEGRPSPQASSDLIETLKQLAGEPQVLSDAAHHSLVQDFVNSLILWLETTLKLCTDPASDTEFACGWLLDNDYQIRRALRQIKNDFPHEFDMRLPIAHRADGQSLPRILTLAQHIATEQHLHLSLPGIIKIIEAFQSVNHLSEAELWAFPTMLRLACLDVLRQTFGMIFEYEDISHPQTLLAAEANAAQSDLSGPALQDNAHLTDRIANVVTALVVLNDIDWHEFVDGTSQVEASLALDPSNAYGHMNRQTRSRYRGIVEDLADRCQHSEVEVALQSVRAARHCPCDSRQAHVGYWLIDEGYAELESRLECSITIRQKIRRYLSRRAKSTYGSINLLFILLSLSVPIGYVFAQGGKPLDVFITFILSLIPASVLSLALTNYFVLKLARTVSLPALDIRYGIPDDAKTVVAVPVIVGSVEEARYCIERLELRHLANPEPCLTFVLLSDPMDSQTQVLDTDALIEEALRTGIRELNARYHDVARDRFVLLHRHRQFNIGQNCWMAYERKRGKLDQFGMLLTEGWLEPFALVEGNIECLADVRYMITLDADTMLPPGSALRMVCTLAHPLNKAYINTDTGRVQAGYTVLQPRVETLSSGGSTSLFAKVFAGDCAIDIYSNAVSDVYQDLFGIGSYVGKGIHDVHAFQQSLEHRVPENAILSHDLFEGIHGRVGLATDIILYEKFPDNWPEYAARQHRWIRGDWQLLPWLGCSVPVASGRREHSVFSLLDRWKLFDNVRRSIIPIALFVFFLAGWLWLPGSASIWTLFAVGSLSPYLLDEAFSGLATISRRHRAYGFSHRIRYQAARALIALAFLVADACNALDAVVRTLWRVYFSGNNLLQWTSSAHASLSEHDTRLAIWKLMWPSPVIALAVTLLLMRVEPNTLIPASPILLCWFLAPWIAMFLAKKRQIKSDSLSYSQQKFLRKTARRTWHYFDDFCQPDDHWLPPDNYQLHQGPILARRTSPTNIGLYLSSTLAARDLGFIGVRECLIRIRNVLDTLEQMDRHRGHWLNWYDTSNLVPLEPRYVSTVDSGNLAVCLLVVKQGCCENDRLSLLGKVHRDGLIDTFQLLIESVMVIDARIDPVLFLQIRDIHAKIESVLSENGYQKLKELAMVQWPHLERSLVDFLIVSNVNDTTVVSEIHVWLERFGHHLQAMLRDLDEYAPWLQVFQNAPTNSVAGFVNMRAALTPDLPLSEQIAAADWLKREILSSVEQNNLDPDTRNWMVQLGNALELGLVAQSELLSEAKALSIRSGSHAYAMDFSWLYDTDCRLFHIGYNLSNSQLDTNHYDLLASEARIASFFAIAKHDVPLEHWFHLGRPVVRHHGLPVAQSWNGSMFEYLMPALFLPGRPDTFLGESEFIAVLSQQADARRRRTPWGVSESGFIETDAQGHYQYQAFGTSELGIRRGLSDDCVIAPYASILALSVSAEAVIDNLHELQSLGATGRYGFMEAIDFTASRTGAIEPFKIVQSWMAHHQGMSLTSIANALQSDCMPRRFLREKSVQAVQLLLQERVPWGAPSEKPRPADSEKARGISKLATIPAAWLPHNTTQLPQVQLLGNGKMTSRITHAGGGAIFLDDIALTRWRDDATRCAEGYRFHVYDHSSGTTFWLSACKESAGTVKTLFANDHVELTHRFSDFVIRLEIAVIARENVDVRRISIVSERSSAAHITVTSFAEVALASVADDTRHPAFSKLFVHSQREPRTNGISFLRRARHSDDKCSALVHSVVCEDGVELAAIETDREKWLGRLGSHELPDALCHELSGSTGWTLDPVMALQVRIAIPPSGSRRCAFLTSAADTPEQAVEQSLRISLSAINYLFADTAQVAARECQHIGIRGDQLPLLQSLASLLIFPHDSLRKLSAGDESVSTVSQPDLWSFGISGDLPILMLQMDDDSPTEHMDILLRAQIMWRRRGLSIDLLVLRTGPASYEEPLRQRLQDSLRDTSSFGWLGRKGGVHLLSECNMGVLQYHQLESAACMVLNTESSIEKQLEAVLEKPVDAIAFQAIGATPRQEIESVEKPVALQFNNSFGGFCEASGDYLIYLKPDDYTPAPWCNILANEQFGSLVSEAGLGFSWSVNSGEHRLTSWSNDPVADTPGEMLFLRDETTAECWTVTPTPRYHTTAIKIRHSTGHTSWQRNSHGLEQELLTFVDVEDPVKCIRLRLKNRSGQSRRLTITYYAEWLLGAVANQTRNHVRCWYEPDTHTILACCQWNPEFAQRLSFITANKQPHSVTGDRRLFLGEHGDVLCPDALQQSDLGGRFPLGGDTCGAYQVHLDLADGGEEEVVFLLGDVKDRDAFNELLPRWRTPEAVCTALQRVSKHWETLTSAVKVKTQDAGFDLMVNRWLIYQTFSSRILARAGFYQAGGAFGFRDQLQDVVALIPTAPARVRQQIILAAQHQFEEGDVLHWWHPPGGRGVRTRITDDRLWLVWVTGRYIEATGDFSILDEEVSFLCATELKEGEHDRYAGYEKGDVDSIYEHCCRAIEASLALGSHGLPLMGTGDWNDGMDCMGDEGRGESVWLAWFQISVIDKFLPLAQWRDDTERVSRYTRHAAQLKESIEMHAWDGEWYIRSFDDEGRPWGSHVNEECRIDAIAQAWGALSGFGHEQRVVQALSSAKRLLLDRELKLVRLLTPPFDQTARNPGYIKAYPPGIRENGGQYSHAAAWLGLAFAQIADADSAYEIFNMINPVSRTTDRDGVMQYAREPYVVCADIGGQSSYAGRGGWSWYTGAAGWGYQLAVHGILGIHYSSGGVRIAPRIPHNWSNVDIRLKQDQAELHVIIDKSDKESNGIVLITVDGVTVEGNEFVFPAAGQCREVRLVLG